jgi:hypothetical protein
MSVPCLIKVQTTNFTFKCEHLLLFPYVTNILELLYTQVTVPKCLLTWIKLHINANLHFCGETRIQWPYYCIETLTFEM